MKTRFFKIGLLSVCVIFYFEISAQNDSLHTDSLKKVLSIQKEDTNKANTLNELANSLSYQATDSSFEYANKGLSLSRKLNYVKGEAESYLILGRNDFFAGNNVSAFTYVKKAIELFRKSGNDGKLLDALNLYVVLITPQKNYREQLNILLEAEKIGIRLHNSDGLQMISGNIGTAYKDLGKWDSAETYYKRAYELSTKIKNNYGRVGHLTSLGLLYLDEGRYKEARDKFNHCLSFSHLDNTAYWIGSVYYGIGKLFLKNKNPDSALYYANKSFEVETTHPDSLYRIADPAQLLSEVYETKNNYKAALHFHKISTSVKDTVYNGERAQQLSSLIMREKKKEQELAAAKIDFENKLQLYISLAVLLVVLIVALLLYRNNKKQKEANIKIEKAYSELKATQAQLIQSEKMASLGELTAGIAHEIQNPLNFVNNFSETNVELLDEVNQELDIGNIPDAKTIAAGVIENERKILYHGKRAEAIVTKMLEHSKFSRGEKYPTDINALADEYLRLSFHGMRAKDKSFNANFKTDFDETIEKVNVVPQDIGRVLLNLFNNAFYAVHEQMKKLGDGYEPTVFVKTKKLNGEIEVFVKDNGIGIPKSAVDKIFQPFFTTKPTGQGTGLGLSLSYDIIKAHGGEIMVESTECESAKFIIKLPIT